MQAVRLVLDGGKSVGSVACDLDLTETALREWVHRARADRTEDRTGPTRSVARKLARLRTNWRQAMFVRTLDDLVPGKGVIWTASWSSHRLLHRDDGLGVTLTDAVLEAGLDQVWWYKNHLEAVYCLEGEGVLEDLGTGKFYEIRPGTLYALDKHERHRLKVKRRMRVICAFVPPLVGGEIHDAEGSYDAG